MNNFGAKNLGDRIREVRADLSQEIFAARISCTRKQVADWERNRTEPSLDNLKKIADAFGVDFIWLSIGERKEDLDERFNTLKEKIKAQALSEEEWKMITSLRKLQIDTYTKFNLCFDYSKAVYQMDEVEHSRVAENHGTYRQTKKRGKT
jgi:transcriptional regulator with XRE-family HTH domain